MALSDQQIAEAKAKHPRSTCLSILDGKVQVVLRPPSRLEMKVFRTANLSNDPAKQSAAGEQLLAQCCLAPDPKDLAAMLEDYPAIVETFVPKLSELAGFTKQVDHLF